MRKELRQRLSKTSRAPRHKRVRKPPNQTETCFKQHVKTSNTCEVSVLLSRQKPKEHERDPKVTQNGIWSQFSVTLGSLWGGALRVTSESLLGHFNSFWGFCRLRSTLTSQFKPFKNLQKQTKKLKKKTLFSGGAKTGFWQTGSLRA